MTRLEPGLEQTGQWRRRNDGQLLRQVLALLRIEDREALQKRDRLGVLAGLAGALFLVVRPEAVGIDDGGAVLALADIAAERERLAKRQPALPGEALLGDAAQIRRASGRERGCPYV